jgi:hypothetical protein
MQFGDYATAKISLADFKWIFNEERLSLVALFAII